MQAIERAIAQFHAGKAELAAATLRRVVQQHPKHAEALHLLALASLHLGQPLQAEHFASRAIAADGGRWEYFNTLGAAQGTLKKHAEAVETFRGAIRLRPDWPGLFNNLANNLMEIGRIAEAGAAWEEALRLDPDHADSLQSFSVLLRQAGRTDLAMPMMRRSAELNPENATTLRCVAVSLNYADDQTPEKVLAAHRALAAAIVAGGGGGGGGGGGPAGALPPLAWDRDPDRKLRVGLLSPDLRTHSVANFLEPLVHHLDRERVALNFYSATPTTDGVTERLRARAAVWRDVRAMDDLALARLVRGDGVDILIDLAGFTAHSRVEALRFRAAPVQATYLGYPSTTGLPGVDWRIVDGLTDPPGSEGACSERLARMADCFLCYAPPAFEDGAPAIGPPPSTVEPRGRVTFGSFNVIMKVSPASCRVWGRALAAVPDSRLLIKAYGVDDAWARRKFLTQFHDAGIDPDRIELMPYAPSRRDHLELYNRIDVALDSYPYCGTTTTCEALWMGVPVVSLVGRTHVARVGLSLLSAVGLGDLAAASEEEFVDRARALAGDVARRAELRATLRERLARSPLGDAPAAARRFEHALRAMWADACARGG